MSPQLREFLSEWTAAERTGDRERLATLLADDFSGVGPLGFVLSRAAWLGRHCQGDEIELRAYNDVAVVTARNVVRGACHGQRLPEAMQVTLVITTGANGMRLAAVHLSVIAGNPGSLPVPAGVVNGTPRGEE